MFEQGDAPHTVDGSTRLFSPSLSGMTVETSSGRVVLFGASVVTVFFSSLSGMTVETSPGRVVLFGASVVPSGEGITLDTSPCKVALFGAAVVASGADMMAAR